MWMLWLGLGLHGVQQYISYFATISYYWLRKSEYPEKTTDLHNFYLRWNLNDRRCFDRMVLGFTTTYAISAYHH
jgi:hypothetical protein